MKATTIIAALVAFTLAAGDADARGRGKHRRAAPSAPVPGATHRPTADEGPDLPWPCWVVRLNAKARGFTLPLTPTMKRKIVELEKAHGITPKQHAQAAACFTDS